MKKAFFTLLGLLLAALAAAVVVFYLSLNTLVQEGVERYGPALTNTRVKLAKAYVNVFSGQAVLEGLELGNPQGFPGPYAAKVASIRLRVDLASLATDKIIIQDLMLTEPVFNLELAGRGDNLEAIRRSIERSAGWPRASGKGGPAGARGQATRTAQGKVRLQVDKLVIRQGLVTIGAGGPDGAARTVPLPYLELRDLGRGGDGLTPTEVVGLILGSLDSQIQSAAARFMGGKAGERTRQRLQQGLEGAAGAAQKMYGQ